MGGDRDLDERVATVARRVEFVELLEADGPLPPRDIVERLSHSRPTVTRALRELRDADLVEQRDGGYAPTLAGTMAAAEYRRYESASRAILTSTELLEPIPPEHAPPVEVLTGAETSLAETAVPLRALEALSDRVQGADRVRAYLPTLVNTQLLRVWHRTVIAGGVESEALVDPDLLPALKGQYPHLLSELAATDGFSAVRVRGPPYGLVLTTSGDTATLAMPVYENGTALRGILTTHEPDAVEWARAELDRLRATGTEVTDDLRALSAAVADGVSQRPGADRSSGPAGPASGRHFETTEDHALPLALESEGFRRLSAAYFDARTTAPPAVSWRTGFTLAEVRGGHAVDRTDDEGQPVTRRLVEALEAGTDHVLLGPPGSGKSTICMAVACEWNDRDLGPVLYRERGDGDRFGSTALLEAYLRQTEGHALVVVEDAIRDEANDVIAVMQALEAEDSVAFLLDARTHEWREPEASELDARRDAYRRTALEEVTVPDLEEPDCERFVDHFTELVGADLDLSGAELFATIQNRAAATGEDGLPAGDALLAQHYLARRYDPPMDADASAMTALDESVRETYRMVADAEERLAPDLAVTVAILTAAGIPVAREYLYAVADVDEYTALDGAVSVLEGRLLFEGDRLQGGSTTYRTRHETWALRFLDAFRAIEPDDRARDRFGRCVTRVLALADESTRRDRIKQHLGGRTPHLHRIEADPRTWADELAERIFGVGRTDASLSPLFGESADRTIELPEACSARTRLRQAYWRGEMNRIHGDLATAEREYRTLGELAEELAPSELTGEPVASDSDRDTGDDAIAHRTRWRARSRTNLGTIARDRGENEVAEEYHREALELFREIDDREGEALSLKNLGIVAFYRSDYEAAREYYERSRDIAVEHGLQRIEADCLNNLAGVAWQQGALDRARESLERSLAISRELGDRRAEFSILNNLGEIAQAQGAYDRGREYYERSLAISRDLGHRRGEAATLNNLGLVAQRQSAYEEARKYLERSLAIKRELGDRQGEARSLNNLGEVHRYQGAYAGSREYLEESLAISRDLDDRQGEAASLHNLGTVAYHSGDHDVAEQHLQDGLTIAREIGAQSVEAASLTDLGRLARNRGEYEAAREKFDLARDTFEAIGSDSGVARVLLRTGQLALERGDIDLAREHGREARETFEALGTTHWEARSRHLLGRVAAATDDAEKAREHWREALATFEDVETPPDALETLAELVEQCLDAGEKARARDWLQQARDTVEEAPEATAAQHRTWIERLGDRLGDE